MSGETRPRDLVLAAVERYDWDTVKPFVESLKATGYDGEIRFFVSGIGRETAACLRAAGVLLSHPRRVRIEVAGHLFRPYNPKLSRLRWRGQPYLRLLVNAASRFARDRRRATSLLAGALANVDVARYFWYWLYLERRLPLYRHVMLTDVRDVIFLRRPFDFPVGGDAFFCLEDARWRLGAQAHNRAWIHGAYGEQALAALRDEPISCSGVTIGAAPAIFDYLTVMVDHLARLPRQYGGMDQGVHNYVLHSGLVPNAQLVPNGEGPVLTLGVMTPESAVELLRARAGDAHVVHQYDRHASVQETLEALTAATDGAET